MVHSRNSKQFVEGVNEWTQCNIPSASTASAIFQSSLQIKHEVGVRMEISRIIAVSESNTHKVATGSYSYPKWIWMSTVNTVDTAKKFCNSRTIISTSSKCITQRIQVNSFTFTCTVLAGFLEYLRNRLWKEVRPMPTAQQDLRQLPTPLNWFKYPKNIDLTDPRQRVNVTPPIT